MSEFDTVGGRSQLRGQERPQDQDQQQGQGQGEKDENKETKKKGNGEEEDEDEDEEVDEEDEEEDEEEGGMFAGLFICEQYVAKRFEFWGRKQALLCSNMSTTDHDLTGQIVWPASKNLSWFIAKNGEELFSGKNVIELGAGCGLAGFIAAQFSKFTAITDGNEVVLRLIKRNIDEKVAVCEGVHEGTVKACELIWGQKQKVVEFLEEAGSPLPDIIVGADVILWPAYTRALLLTVRWLLALKPRTSKCYISYLNRAQSTTDLLYKNAKDLNLIVKEISLDTFLPPKEEVDEYLAKASSLAEEDKNEAYCERMPVMFMLDISLDLEAFGREYPDVNLSDSCTCGTQEVSTMFEAMPSEADTWIEEANFNNSPF